MDNPLYPQPTSPRYNSDYALPVVAPEFSNYAVATPQPGLTSAVGGTVSVPTINYTPVAHDPFSVDTARGGGATANLMDRMTRGGPVPFQAAAKVAGSFLRITDPDNEENRFQFWPERMVRSAVTLPGDVATGREPIGWSDQSTNREHLIERVQDG